jgi:hypothetical protein
MKRVVSLLTCVLVGTLLFTACGNVGTATTDQPGQSPSARVPAADDPPDDGGALADPSDEYFIWAASDPTLLSGLTEEGKKLTEVVVPGKAKQMRKSVFTGNKIIEKVTFEGANIEFNEDFPWSMGLFEACESLRWVQLPPELEILPPESFTGCTVLETVIMPSELREVGALAFNGCKALKTVTLGKAETIGGGAFIGCMSLDKITIPETMETIKENAFFGCSALQELQFDGVVTIKKYAFSYCDALKRVELPETLQELGNAVFRESKSLESVRLPASLEKIERVPFLHSPITTIEVKEGSPAAEAMLKEYADTDVSIVYY